VDNTSRSGHEVRGAYYKERATRVTQPMIDAKLDVGERGELDLHTLVDSITSASAASGAAGTSFNESRFELGAAYTHEFDGFRLGGGARASDESDYTSFFGHLRGELELDQKNTTLALLLAEGRDTASNAGAQGLTSAEIGGTLYSTVSSLSLAQVLGRRTVGQVIYDFTYLKGFQENPYRTVTAGGMLESERLPETRLRHAVAGSLRHYFAATRTTGVAAYRFYIDNWGLAAHTAEARLVEDLTDQLSLGLRYRFHGQWSADFYREIYDSADPAIEPFLTADFKLSTMRTQTLGGKVDAALGLLGFRGELADVHAEALFEYVWQTSYVGNAVIAELALAIPLRY
jgi:hypothetical protein